MGTPLLEAAEGEDVEVAEADTFEGGSSDDSVVGNGNVGVNDVGVPVLLPL
jgi:hypothetical protein